MKIKFILLILVFLLFSCSQDNSIIIDINSSFLEISNRENQLSNIKKRGFITYIDENHQFNNLPFSIDDNILEIKVIKGNIVPILLNFETDSLNFAISGFLYPIVCDFSIHSAYCSYIYQKILKGSDENIKISSEFCSYFNWYKFYESIQKFENPFLLDSDLICSDIATNQFSAFSLKLKE